MRAAKTIANHKATNRRYEVVLAFAPQLLDSQISEEQSAVEVVIKSHDGEIEKTDSIGIRPLGYKIQGFDSANFTVLIFNARPTVVKDLRRQLSINERVLRHLVATKDKYAPDLSFKAREEREKAAEIVDSLVPPTAPVADDLMI